MTFCGAFADPVRRWAGHPNPKVRLGVAQGLLGYDERAIAVLIALTSDEQAAIRDWATLGIGTQTDADSEAKPCFSQLVERALAGEVM